MPSLGRVDHSEKLDHEQSKTRTRASRGSKTQRPCIASWKNAAWMSISFGVAYLTYRFQPVLPYSHAVCVSAGGTIYTAEPDSPFVQCLAFKDTQISFVGNRLDLERLRAQALSPHPWLARFHSWLKFAAPSTYIGQLAIKTLDGDLSILPGLIDAHAHPLEYGEGLVGVDLLGCTSVQSIIDRIISHISLDSAAESSGIIRGSGWDQTLFEGKQFPSAAALSSHPKLKQRKIVLRRIDYHAYWVSQTILHQVLANNPPLEIEGGLIVRDQDGHPTGIFVDNAMDLVDEILPKRTDEDRLRYLESTAKEMLSLGLTTVNDAATDLETIAFYKRLDAQDKLPVRVTGMVNCGYTFCGDQVEKVTGNKFNLRSVKLFVDGALGSWGAALWEPYSDKNSSRGVLRASWPTFLPLIQRWVEAGFQVNSHAIGDRANTLVIDAYEQVLSQLSSSTHAHSTRDSFNSLRLRIEHAQVLRPTDMERMGRMGIIASVQPTHAIADMDYAEDRLGSERIQGAYAWNSLLKNNVRLALGSDFPVTGVSPFLGMHAAYTRRKPTLSNDTADVGRGWYDTERISSMQQIVDGFTIDASFAGFTEHLIGSLRVGKLADFVVVNHNLFHTPASRDLIADRILQTHVLATFLNGRMVFNRSI